jgi:hypothetical protein
MNCHANDSAALDHALDVMSVCAPEETRRARAALAIALGGVRASTWPEVAWAFSRLTPDGFPIELTFSSLGSGDIRYVIEAAGPETPEHDRIHHAFRIYAALAGRGAAAAASESEQVLAAMQQGRELEFGAWVGAVHSRQGDRYKIYVEIPSGGVLPGIASALFDRKFPLPHCQPVPLMFGLQPDNGVREIYFRARGLTDADFGLLLRRYGLGHCYRDALDLVESTWARSGLPPAVAGFSVAATPDGSSRAVSIFAGAEVLFGSDANIRRTLLKLGRKLDWSLSLYEGVSASIEDHNGLSTRHGIIAWIVSNRGPVELRIGLRPGASQFPAPSFPHTSAGSLNQPSGEVPPCLLAL